MKILSLKQKQSGFTIVELLIVIVVIGILAAITVVAYNGIQQRARDTERTTDIKQLHRSLERFYAVKITIRVSPMCEMPAFVQVSCKFPKALSHPRDSQVQ
ncbi:type II secretion system protein G [compost metagenome]